MGSYDLNKTSMELLLPGQGYMAYGREIETAEGIKPKMVSEVSRRAHILTVHEFYKFQ